ncbi:MAG: hypothetical protein KDA41_15835, partial [Planctomycetales bacterium]|nr:hypothetical protein [Planctomycetales bacterium]
MTWQTKASAALLSLLAALLGQSAFAASTHDAEALTRWLLEPAARATSVAAFQRTFVPRATHAGATDRSPENSLPVEGASRWSTAFGEGAAPYGRPYAQTASSPVDEAIAAQLPDDRDVLKFAAGGIEMKIPLNWLVTEVNVGREVRLYVTPDELHRKPRSLTAGLWIAYHVREPVDDAQAELETMMERRFAQAAPQNLAAGRLERGTLDGRPAVRRQFRAAAASDGAAAELRGLHLLARADWGVVEVHTIAAADQPQLAATLVQAISDIRLHTPRIRRGDVAAAASSAQPIIGTWKSTRGRLVLFGRGQVVMEYDSAPLRQLDASTSELRRPPRRLQGEFVARDDVLWVTWDDGSKLNLRWRVDHGQLLLTDHEGRISQLERL